VSSRTRSTRATRTAAARESWRARWAGLVGWFLPDGDRPAQAELLRARARAAIPALLQAIAEVNERRLSRSDRAGDLRQLARWFAACDTDADAHRLWRAAFALAPARHLTVDHDTLSERDQHRSRPPRAGSMLPRCASAPGCGAPAGSPVADGSTT
jgi:uncharacterized protein (TIGR02677 family)